MVVIIIVAFTVAVLAAGFIVVEFDTWIVRQRVRELYLDHIRKIEQQDARMRDEIEDITKRYRPPGAGDDYLPG